MSFPQTIYTPTADSLAVSNVSAKFATLVMATSQVYRYVCTVDSWIKQGAAADNPVASAAATSAFVPALSPVFLDGKNGDTLAAIRQGAVSGTASLSLAGLAKLTGY